MKLTVNQILHTEGFEKFRVICGNRGLNREVSSVSVIDAPDIYNWLQGGEILLTSGYIFKDNTEYLLELIEKIAKNGAAALFIKLGRFIDDMPDEVHIKADELSFPIVYMPFSFYSGFDKSKLQTVGNHKKVGKNTLHFYEYCN